MRAERKVRGARAGVFSLVCVCIGKREKRALFSLSRPIIMEKVRAARGAFALGTVIIMGLGTGFCIG